LFVAGRAHSLIEGWDLAGELIDAGDAMKKLDELTQKD
jgi:anthranilate phosphoribosyltransferase